MIEPPAPTVIQMPQQDFYALFDPALLRAGQDIYTLYCELNPDREHRRQPIGIAMNKISYRGKLVFSSYPILLPQECFITLDQLESALN